MDEQRAINQSDIFILNLELHFGFAGDHSEFYLKKIPLRKEVSFRFIKISIMATVLFHKQDLVPESHARILEGFLFSMH